MSEAKTFSERQNDARGAAWNQCISPRLLGLRAHFSDEAYKEGIAKYMEKVHDQQIKSLIGGASNRDEDQYLRGRISMIAKILALPEAVERQIEVQQQMKKQEDSRGDAGY